MISRTASAYDQNPARLALIVKSNRPQPTASHRSGALGVLIGLGVLVACVWRILPL